MGRTLIKLHRHLFVNAMTAFNLVCPATAAVPHRHAPHQPHVHANRPVHVPHPAPVIRPHAIAEG